MLCDFVVDIAALGQLSDNALQRTGLAVQPCGQSHNGSFGASQLCKLCRGAAGLTNFDHVAGRPGTTLPFAIEIIRQTNGDKVADDTAASMIVSL